MFWLLDTGVCERVGAGAGVALCRGSDAFGERLRGSPQLDTGRLSLALRHLHGDMHASLLSCLPLRRQTDVMLFFLAGSSGTQSLRHSL